VGKLSLDNGHATVVGVLVVGGDDDDDGDDDDGHHVDDGYWNYDDD